jgi:Zn-dependent peptidase ImmA (M78 family)
MKVRKELIKLEIEDILKDNQDLIGPPVDVIALCKRLGFRYEEEALEQDTSGAAVVDGNTKIVLINLHHHGNRKRFTAAHEIGHLLLHKNLTLNLDRHSPVVLFRDGKSSKGYDWKEKEANYFAAQLLMPEKLILNRLEKHDPGHLTENDVEEIAAEFQVSTQAMCIRLSQLGFVSY